MCLNKKVLIGLAAVAVGVLLLKPSWFVAALPLLVLALCPLSMVFMMRGMKGGQTKSEAGSSCATGSKTDKTATTSAGERELNDKIGALQAELRSLKAAQAQRDGIKPAEAEEAVRLTKDAGPDTRA